KDVSPAGSGRFLARAWRLSGEVDSPVGTNTADGDRTLRAVTHRFLADAPGLIESLKFNVVVARLMELTNQIRKTVDAGPGAADPAVREAVETLALGLALFSPYTAEDMWERLGHEPSIANVVWAEAEPALLVEDTVTCVVQVNGKVRDRLDVSPDIGEADLEEAAEASKAVQRAVGEGSIVKVIVRAPKLVNFVVK
ncbi:class I tRNA ligase family protein, partial [uncultured Agrococcus sp.]|uniref:class I tRNA ligase family protein n=1 Tax=uncultured Agrococcus sp. TaxID=382258 RepID=UPI0026002C13